MNFRVATLFCLVFRVAVASWAADPKADLQAFSLFKSFDPASLTPSSIVTERLGSMSFRRGLSIQSCFLAEAPMARTVELLRNWNPSSHQALNVLYHQPVKLPIDANDFSILKLDGGQRAERWLVEMTASSGILANLYLSKAEAMPKPTKADPTDAAGFWANLLGGRAQAFFAGGLKNLPDYELSGSTFRPEQELKALLQDMPPIAAKFSPLLDETVNSPRPADCPHHPVGYWELLSVTGEGTLNLGATFTQEGEGSSEVIDCQYYANSNYFLNLMLYQLWPLSYQGKDYTLIWRCDLIASPTLEDYRGVERMAAANLTIQNVKEAIRSFQEDVRNEK